MNLTRIAIERPSLIIVLFGVLFLGGFVAYRGLGVEMMPDFSQPVITDESVWRASCIWNVGVFNESRLLNKHSDPRLIGRASKRLHIQPALHGGGREALDRLLRQTRDGQFREVIRPAR